PETTSPTVRTIHLPIGREILRSPNFVRHNNHCPRPYTRFPVSRTSMDIIWKFHQRLQELRLDLDDDDLSVMCTIPANTMPPILSFVVRKVEPTDADTEEMLELHFPSLLDIFLASPPTPLSDRHRHGVRIGGHETLLEAADIPGTVHVHRFIHWPQYFPICIFDGVVSFDLQSLNITARDWSADALRDFHARSGFNLTRLELAYLDLGTDGLIPFLRVMPTLRHLSLRHSDYLEDKLFEALIHESSTDSLDLALPHLTNLALDIYESFSGDLVADMVESLLRAVPTVTSPCWGIFNSASMACDSAMTPNDASRKLPLLVSWSIGTRRRGPRSDIVCLASDS
ncbi:hypothetical protein FB451DRAFT_1532974, partial [Mycena latifolia]